MSIIQLILLFNSFNTAILIINFSIPFSTSLPIQQLITHFLIYYSLHITENQYPSSLTVTSTIRMTHKHNKVARVNKLLIIKNLR